MTGARERWRLRLAPTGDRHDLVGFAFLAWGDGVTVRRSASPSGWSGSLLSEGCGSGRRGTTPARARDAARVGDQPPAELGIAAGGRAAPARARVHHTDCRSVIVCVSGCLAAHILTQPVDVDELRVDPVAVPAAASSRLAGPQRTSEKCDFVERLSTSGGRRSPTSASIASVRERCQSAAGWAASAARKPGSWSGCDHDGVVVGGERLEALEPGAAGRASRAAGAAGAR